jgi:hypothetical protein
LWAIFALLDPDPDPDSGSGSTGPIEYVSNPDPDLKPWFTLWYLSVVTDKDGTKVLVGDMGRKYIPIWKAGRGRLKPTVLINPV